MANAMTSILGRTFNRLAELLGAMAGPILTKELRISSRRRRNFVLRGVYLAMLTAFVVLVWLATVKWESYGTHAYRISRMFEAGRTIIVYINWFQFIVLQIVTVIMLSTAISEEIYAKTLGVLMTTPIRSFQIVIGKLFSKILQLLLLLAASLPMLAVLRVLGGVPWSFVIASLCVTLTTALLVASVTMFFSIVFRWAFVSILMSVGTMAVVYAGVPFIVGLVISAGSLYRETELMEWLLSLFIHSNPYATMTFLTVMVFNPGRMGMGSFPIFYWWVTCLVSLGISALVLTACVAMVRKVGLRLVAGATGAGPSNANAIAASAATAAVARPVLAPLAPSSDTVADAPPVLEVLQPVTAAPPPMALPPARGVKVREIKGSPIVWRELRSKWLKRGVLYWVLVGVGAWLLLLIYGLIALAEHDAFYDNDVHVGFIIVYTIIASLVTCVLAATNITNEKESRSWELLLCTPMSDWHILLAKFIGTVRRCLPIWLIPIGHILLFTLFRCCNVGLLPLYLLIVVSILTILAGAGLYFGARFKRTTTAVILNLSLGLGLWLVLPGALALAGEAMPRNDFRREFRDATEYIVDGNPFFQAVMVSERLSGRRGARKSIDQIEFYWASSSSRSDRGYIEATSYLTLFCAMHIAMAAFMAWRAKCQFRKRWV